jgi:hypothetical protein
MNLKHQKPPCKRLMLLERPYKVTSSNSEQVLRKVALIEFVRSFSRKPRKPFGFQNLETQRATSNQESSLKVQMSKTGKSAPERTLIIGSWLCSDCKFLRLESNVREYLGCVKKQGSAKAFLKMKKRLQAHNAEIREGTKKRGLKPKWTPEDTRLYEEWLAYDKGTVEFFYAQMTYLEESRTKLRLLLRKVLALKAPMNSASASKRARLQAIEDSADGRFDCESDGLESLPDEPRIIHPRKPQQQRRRRAGKTIAGGVRPRPLSCHMASTVFHQIVDLARIVRIDFDKCSGYVFNDSDYDIDSDWAEDDRGPMLKEELKLKKQIRAEAEARAAPSAHEALSFGSAKIFSSGGAMASASFDGGDGYHEESDTEDDDQDKASVVAAIVHATKHAFNTGDDEDENDEDSAFYAALARISDDALNNRDGNVSSQSAAANARYARVGSGCSSSSSAASSLALRAQSAAAAAAGGGGGHLPEDGGDHLRLSSSSSSSPDDEALHYTLVPAGDGRIVQMEVDKRLSTRDHFSPESLWVPDRTLRNKAGFHCYLVSVLHTIFANATFVSGISDCPKKTECAASYHVCDNCELNALCNTFGGSEGDASVYADLGHRAPAPSQIPVYLTQQLTVTAAADSNKHQCAGEALLKTLNWIAVSQAAAFPGQPGSASAAFGFILRNRVTCALPTWYVSLCFWLYRFCCCYAVFRYVKRFPLPA